MHWPRWTAMFTFFRRATKAKKVLTTISHTQNTSRPVNKLPVLALVGVAKVANEINKSKSDDRKYRGLELKNGMKVLLVSDPETERAACAMNVHIGCMKDPRELPGLAHFCEHMLFMGTEKYPGEDDYEKFISEHGGSSNAYTDLEHTNYSFEILPEHLPQAFDRFGQFFIAPLFSPSAVEREVRAVDSENQNNLMNDSWRLFQLTRSLADPSHDLNKFGTGNKDTLLTIPKSQGIDVRAELVKFHQTWYSANIMGCCIVGREGLDELQAMAQPLLEKIPNKNISLPRWENPYTPELLPARIHVVPIQDVSFMFVTWPTPDVADHYRENPAMYVDHLIGHEGAGSLLSELKARGWCNFISGGQTLELSGFALFSVTVDLTEEGLKHTDDIVTLIYQYINMIKEKGPQEWVFNECKDLAAMMFHLKDKEDPLDYCVGLSSRITEIPLQDALTAYMVIDNFRPDLINSILNRLTPSNMKVGVVSKSFKGKTDTKEKWYGTQYKKTKIGPEQVKIWKNSGAHKNLKLPAKNEFIPQNFDIVHREKQLDAPELIKKTDLTRLWYKQDSRFLKPKAIISLTLENPVAYRDPLGTYCNFLFTQLFNDAMTEVSYMATQAGVSYSLDNSPLGLSLDVGGFNDKLLQFLKIVVDKLVTFEIDPKKIAILNEMNKRTLHNFDSDQPFQQAVFYTTQTTSEKIWSYPEIRAVVDGATAEQLQRHVKELMSRLFIEAFVYGNITKQQARQLMTTVEEGLKGKYNTRPLPESERAAFREVKMPDESYFVREAYNKVQPSHAVDMYLQTGEQGTRSNVLLELLAHVIEQPCFNILRNQEQLGYIVLSAIRRSKGVQGLRLLVQSPLSAEHVEKRIEAFLDHMDDYISDMHHRTFLSHKEALSAERLEAPSNMFEENGYWLSEINAGTYHFKRDEVEVAEIEKLTKEDLYEFFREYIAVDGPKRHKLAVRVISLAPRDEDGQEDPDDRPPSSDVLDLNLLPSPDLPPPTFITDVYDFKNAMHLYPPVKPYVDLNSMRPEYGQGEGPRRRPR